MQRIFGRLDQGIVDGERDPGSLHSPPLKPRGRDNCLNPCRSTFWGHEKPLKGSNAGPAPNVGTIFGNGIMIEPRFAGALVDTKHSRWKEDIWPSNTHRYDRGRHH